MWVDYRGSLSTVYNDGEISISCLYIHMYIYGISTYPKSIQYIVNTQTHDINAIRKYLKRMK